MTTQIELNLASKKPKVETQDTQAFIDNLNLIGDWVPAETMLWRLTLPRTDSGKRKLRALAEASNGIIISGQKGYRHIAHATPDEINHAASWLEHQAKLMASRAQAIRRQAHKLVH